MEEHPEIVQSVRKELNDTVFPRHLSFLEKFLVKSSTGWIANSQGPTIAEFLLVPRLQWLASGVHDGISTEILAKFPAIRAWIDRFGSLHAIRTYYSRSD